MSHVYILRSIDHGTYYVGSTINIQKRLAKHNNGEVKSTCTKRPWELMHVEIYATLAEARKREAQIKLWKSRNAIERLIRNKKVIVPSFL